MGSSSLPQRAPRIMSGWKALSSVRHGKLSYRPPSHSIIESISTGGKTTGMAIDARTASARSPDLSSTARWRLTSVAMQRKGTISLSKSPRQATLAGLKSCSSAMSICEVFIIERGMLSRLRPELSFMSRSVDSMMLSMPCMRSRSR